MPNIQFCLNIKKLSELCIRIKIKSKIRKNLKLPSFRYFFNIKSDVVLVLKLSTFLGQIKGDFGKI